MSKYYNNYNGVTKNQLSEIYKLKDEYKAKGIEIPFCKTYAGAEAVINKYKFTMKGLPAPITKNQQMILDKLKYEYGIKLPKITNQKQAAEIIDEYDKKYHILNHRRLKHYHEKCLYPNMNISDNQILVLEGLKMRYGNDLVPEFKNHGEAWDFIAKFQDIIYINENGMYIDNINININKIRNYKINQQKEISTNKVQNAIIHALKEYHGDKLTVPESLTVEEANQFIRANEDKELSWDCYGVFVAKKLILADSEYTDAELYEALGGEMESVDYLDI